MNRLQTAICSTLPVSLIILIISFMGYANHMVNAMGGLRKESPENVDFLTRISSAALVFSLIVGSAAFFLWFVEQCKDRPSD